MGRSKSKNKDQLHCAKGKVAFLEHLNFNIAPVFALIYYVTHPLSRKDVYRPGAIRIVL